MSDEAIVDAFIRAKIREALAERASDIDLVGLARELINRFDLVGIGPTATLEDIPAEVFWEAVERYDQERLDAVLARLEHTEHAAPGRWTVEGWDVWLRPDGYWAARSPAGTFRMAKGLASVLEQIAEVVGK
jgi:hypothetical protein